MRFYSNVSKKETEEILNNYITNFNLKNSLETNNTKAKIQPCLDLLEKLKNIPDEDVYIVTDFQNIQCFYALLLFRGFKVDDIYVCVSEFVGDSYRYDMAEIFMLNDSNLSLLTEKDLNFQSYMFSEVNFKNDYLDMEFSKILRPQISFYSENSIRKDVSVNNEVVVKQEAIDVSKIY